jgi:hypothetical protein
VLYVCSLISLIPLEQLKDFANSHVVTFAEQRGMPAKVIAALKDNFVTGKVILDGLLNALLNCFSRVEEPIKIYSLSLKHGVTLDWCLNACRYH